MIRVFIPSALYSYTDHAAEVEGRGTTLADVLADLDARYPGIRFRVVDEQDRPREHIRFFVNGELARRIDLPVGPNDEVHVITALSGGSEDDDERPDYAPKELSFCSEHESVQAVDTCALCDRPVCSTCLTTVNGHPACSSCTDRVRTEVSAEQPDATTYPRAIAGGLAGALAGAVVWAAIAIAGNVEVGYVAVLVGFLAGLGVVKLSGKRSQGLQVVAVSCAVVGLVAAKYFTMAHVLIGIGEKDGQHLGYFDPLLFKIFAEVGKEMFGPFDILWIILAVGAAWKAPAPTNLDVERFGG